MKIYEVILNKDYINIYEGKIRDIYVTDNESLGAFDTLSEAIAFVEDYDLYGVEEWSGNTYKHKQYNGWWLEVRELELNEETEEFECPEDYETEYTRYSYDIVDGECIER